MPRKPKDPSAPPPPKRVRKTKKDKEIAAQAAAAAAAAEQKIEMSYDPLMATNGMMLMDDVYNSHEFVGYYGNGFEPVSYSTATSTPSTMTPTSSGSATSLPPPPVPVQQLTPSSTPGSMQGAPGMRPGPGSMGTPTPGMPMNGGPPPPHHLPTPTPIEFRIHDMNRRFYLFLNTGVQEKDYGQWWDAFSHEFFDDDSKMTFVLLDHQGKQTEKYTIGRPLIPRYFRTLLDGGMNELYYVIKGQSVETPTAEGLTRYECNNFMQVSKYEQPYQSEVQTDATIKLEFTPYEEMFNFRIKTWHIELQPSQEFQYDPHSRAFTPLTNIPPNMRRPMINGMSPASHQALKFSVILEPMQMIMSTCKGQPQLSPQDALKRICFARHQQQQQAQMHAQQSAQLMQQQQQQQQQPEDAKAKPTRKRTRKAPANPKGAKKGAAPAIQSPAPPGGGGFVAPQGIPPQSMHYHGVPEVYVVGEPSMLGGEFREDERQIDKIENPNYDPNAAARPPPTGPPPGMMAHPQMGHPGPASLQQMQQHHQLQQLSAGGQPPQQQQAPPGHPHHMQLGAGGPHGSMGPPMIPQQQLQQQGTPPGAGGMPNGLQPPPPAGYEYLGQQWPHRPLTIS